MRTSGSRARQLGAAARTAVRRTPETLMVARYRAQPAAAMIARLTVTALFAYGAALLTPYTSSPPVLAPLSALLVAQVTLFQTVRSAIQRVAAVVAGVLMAVTLSEFVGFTWWSLGIVIALGLVIGYALRLGETILEVPISAMLVLSAGAAKDQTASGRVVETLVGAATGLIAGFVLAAPRTESAQQAISGLCGTMSALLDRMAAGVSSGAAAEQAGRWLGEARALSEEIERTDEAVRHAEESITLNPRGPGQAAAEIGLRDSLESLEHAAITVRGLARSVADLTRLGEADADASILQQEERGRLAAVLAELSEVVHSYDRLATSRGPADAQRAESGLREHLDIARQCQDNLSGALAADPSQRPVGWPLRGELVSHVDRLRTELNTTAGPVPGQQISPSRPLPRLLLPRLLRSARRRLSEIARR